MSVTEVVVGRTCIRCCVEKPCTEFCRQPRRKDGLFPYCKTCSNTQTAEWRRRNPDATRAIRARFRDKYPFRNKEYALKNSYGITRSDYEAMLEGQCGRCAVCRQEIVSSFIGKVSKKVVACVDHDHSTGVVRGLVCQRCNYVVGCVETHRAIVEAAREYLGRPSC